MKKYLVLYRVEEGGPSAAEMMAHTTPEQMKAGMAIWQSWQQKAAGAIVDMGAPLDHSHIVTSNGTTAGKGSITGYSVLQAGSMNEALELIQGHPHFHGRRGFIEILETVPMPGM